MWRIARGLYLGDRKDARDLVLLRGQSITHIVNCAVELPCWYRQELRYLELRLHDPDDRFHDCIKRFCRFIDRGRGSGGVLVHCVAGLSRSPSVILAYLCWRGKSLEEALKILQRSIGESDQEFIVPDSTFLEQIEAYFEDDGGNDL